MRCWVRCVGRVRVSCRHEAGDRVGHGVGGVVGRGVFCGPVGWLRDSCGSARAPLGTRGVLYGEQELSRYPRAYQ